MNHRSRRAGVRIASYTLALIAVLSGFIYVKHNESLYYQRQVELSYQHAFSELVDCMNQIDYSLQKGMYVTSPSMLSSLCSDIYGKVSTAEMSLGLLPHSAYELENTASFINRIGDYMYVLSRKNVNGETFTEEEIKNLKALSLTAGAITTDLNEMQLMMNQGAISLSDTNKAVNSIDQVEEVAVPDNVGGGVKLMEQEFPDIPELIYDGPFSEHIEKREPEMLKGQSELSEEEVKQKINGFFGFTDDQLHDSGGSEGKIKTYTFNGEKNGDSFYIEASRIGGHVVNAFCSRMVSEAKLTPEECVNKAKAFLDERGMTDMVESYWIINSNKVTVNFAYQQDGITCYSDLVKIVVAQDNGEIMGYESEGYLMSHKERQFEEPSVTSEQASEKVSPELEILSTDLVLVPSNGQNEILCHEFKCKSSDNRHFIIYVNSKTGNEEKILILLEDENGTLTI